MRATLQVTQKKNIKRQKDRLEGLKQEAEEERARARQAARERVVKDFERGQLKLASGPSTVENGGSEAKETKTDERERNICTAYSFPSTFIQLEERSVKRLHLVITPLHHRTPFRSPQRQSKSLLSKPKKPR